jgi:uncharacterized surface anchored protein
MLLRWREEVQVRKCSVLPGRLTILSLWLVLFSADSAMGQLYTGSLTGIVVDPSDTPAMGAQITLIDSDRSIHYATKTDASGRYLFRSLAPGNYALQLEAAGFDVFELKNITIEVNGSAPSRRRDCG